jgi:hypothetical protein
MDRKSDYYTSAQHYRDLDGNSKSFTFVDHDVKPSISVTSSTKEDIELIKKEVRDHTERVIEEILSFPAVNILKNSYGMYEEFVIRNAEKGVIEWNEEMVRNACRINDILRYNMSIAIWKGSVKEQHWFDDMSHEDIIAGKWKELI